MEGGWIKIYYSMQKWEWYDVPEMVALFVHLIVDANYEDREWHGMTIERGQLVTSIAKLAKRVGISVQQTRTCLSRLEGTGEIVTKSTNKFTIITISNYDRYQSSPETNQQTNNKQSTTPKESKKYILESDNNCAGAHTHTPAPTREDEPIPHPPSQTPFYILSSVELASCNFIPVGIVQIKRNKLRAMLEGIAGNPEIDMPKDEQEAFIDWFCEPVSEGSSTVRAENLTAFTVYGSAKRWMDKRRQQQQARQTPKEKQSLSDYYKDLIKEMRQRYGTYQQSDTGVPEEQ